MYLYFALYKYVPTTILQLFTYYSTTYYYVVWILSTDFNYSTPKELTFFAINPLELMWSNSFTTTMHKSSLLFPNMSQTLVWGKRGIDLCISDLKRCGGLYLKLG